MTPDFAHAWYVYSVLPAAENAPPGDGVLPGAPVEAMRFENLTVLASQVPRALFDSENAANRTADADWMAARIQAHHAVNVAATAAGSCLPLAFGALFSSLDLLHNWLVPRTPALQAALAQVAGQTEWALSMQEDAVVHAAWLLSEDSALKRLAEAVAAAGEGTAFLMARRLEKARAAARLVHIDAVAASVARQLSDIGFGVLDETRRAGLPGWTLLVSNGLKPDQPNEPSERVRLLAAGFSATGLSLRLSGPWPAYAYARFALAQAAGNG